MISKDLENGGGHGIKCHLIGECGGHNTYRIRPNFSLRKFQENSVPMNPKPWTFIQLRVKKTRTFSRA